MCSGNEAKLDFDLSVGLETEAFEAMIVHAAEPHVCYILYVVETWHCHKADVPTPGHGKGDGARKIRVIAKAMTKEIVGGAEVRRSRTEFHRWQRHANGIQK